MTSALRKMERMAKGLMKSTPRGGEESEDDRERLRRSQKPESSQARGSSQSRQRGSTPPPGSRGEDASSSGGSLFGNLLPASTLFPASPDIFGSRRQSGGSSPAGSQRGSGSYPTGSQQPDRLFGSAAFGSAFSAPGAPSPAATSWLPGSNLDFFSDKKEEGLLRNTLNLEELEESRVCGQVFAGDQSPNSRYAPTTNLGPQRPSLPGGGRCDHLLKPGQSANLCQELASIFQNDPPVNSGATDGHTAGRSCSYGEKYPQLVFSPEAIARTLEVASSLWDPSPRGNVLRLQVVQGSRMLVVGDTHGQLEDVLWMFYKYGLPSATNQYFYNGDIVDRGGHALEILLLLLCIKRDAPNSLHIQRGNHEDCQVNVLFGFKNEVFSKLGERYGGPILHLCQSLVFPLLPLATLVSDAEGAKQIAIVHGGPPVDCFSGYSGPLLLSEPRDPSSKRPCLARMNRMRPCIQAMDDDESKALFNLVWADPAESVEEKSRPNQRGNKFVEADTVAFCKENGVTCVVRSHEVPKNLRGLVQKHNGRCCTIFSASNYMGTSNNRGGVLVLEGMPLKFSCQEHWAPPWPMLFKFCAIRNASEKARRIAEWEGQFDIAHVIDMCQPCTAPQRSSSRSSRSLSRSRYDRGEQSPQHNDRASSHPPPQSDAPCRSSSSRARSSTPSRSDIRQSRSSVPDVASFPGGYPQSPQSTGTEKNLFGMQPLSKPNGAEKSLFGTQQGSKPKPHAAAAEQRKQYLMERVVEYKEPLYEAFSAHDRQQKGSVPRTVWFEVMLTTLTPHCQGFLTRAVLEEFAMATNLPDPVEYCRFLHRFQIRSEEKKDAHADNVRRMTMLRNNVSDLSDVDMRKLLDPNGDHLVTREEFYHFLQSAKVQVLPWQSAAIYETMVSLSGENPLKLDRIITCISVMGRSCIGGRNQISLAAQQVGKEMQSTGHTIPSFFRRWDVDKNGFLSLMEIEKGIHADLKSLKFSHEEVSSLVEFIDSTGVTNGRVSLVEFVRALTPHEVLTALQKAMMREVLKRVWMGRPRLLTWLARHDPDHVNRVPTKVFREGIEELNKHFQQQGRSLLSDTQVNAICEIASGSSRDVGYTAFLNSLHIADTGIR